MVPVDVGYIKEIALFSWVSIYRFIIYII